MRHCDRDDWRATIHVANPTECDNGLIYYSFFLFFLPTGLIHAIAAVTKSEKIAESSVRGWLPTPSSHPYIVEYAANFRVPNDFGRPGAVLITNFHGREFHLMEIVIHGFKDGPVFFPANTWIHSRKDNPESRIIFSNQVRNKKGITLDTSPDNFAIAAWMVDLKECCH